MKRIAAVLMFVFLSNCAHQQVVVKEPTVEIETRDTTAVITAIATTYTVKRRCDFAVALNAGGYDWVSEYFTPERFPTPDGCVEGEVVEVRLFNSQEMNQEDVITTAQVRDGMSRQNHVPADWTVLLPLGEKFPELQRKFKIIALGSDSRYPVGYVNAPLLCEHNGERSLSLPWVEPQDEWDNNHRFAALSASSS